MNKSSGYGLVLAVIIVLSQAPAALACTVCHSKNPKMRQMHEALGYKDCFTCHGPPQKKSREERMDQKKNDPRCISCHKKQ